MKLCVIGGAGARSAFLTKSLVKSARDIRVDHIVLLDNDQQKLKTYGEISRELARRLDPELTFEVTSDARAALTGVDYIITTIRAILEDDRDAAVKGLALHPLVNDFELAETLTDIFFDKYADFIHMNETP